MQKLYSSICLRVIDAFGLISKDMMDVRQQTFEQSQPRTWALSVQDQHIIVKQQDDSLIVFISTDQNIYYVFDCNDKTNEHPEENNVYCLIVDKQDIQVRDVSVIELANILMFAELIRNFNMELNIYSLSKVDTKTLNYFLKENL
jgi:hypothetical protein